MTVQTDFLKRCKALNLHDGKLSDWLDEIESLRQQLTELLNWQQKAFAAHPNIDIDIDRMN